MANVLTGIRILCGILILFFPAFSKWFMLFYLVGAFTDAIDGTVARKMGTASGFGAKFDTVADFIFTLGVIYKIIRALYVPLWLIIWIVVIILIKVACHLAGYIKYHELRTMHSLLNKVCGVCIFFVPLFIGYDYARQAKALVVIALCIFATIAAIVEGIKIIK